MVVYSYTVRRLVVRDDDTSTDGEILIFIFPRLKNVVSLCSDCEWTNGDDPVD